MMLCLDAFFTVKDKIILLFNKFYKGPKRNILIIFHWAIFKAKTASLLENCL